LKGAADRARADRVDQEIGARVLNVTPQGELIPGHPYTDFGKRWCRLLAMFAPLFIAAAALAVGLALRKLIDRFLDKNDSRRFCIAQAMLYARVFAAIAVQTSAEPCSVLPVGVTNSSRFHSSTP
jgi:hypothetical protein